MTEETITISRKDYDALVSQANFLEALERAGVDNWQGYSIAWEILEGSEEYD